MLTAYTLTPSGPVWHEAAADGKTLAAQDVRWVDLLSPTRDEELVAEQFLGVAIPTRAEAQEIEFSSRLYTEDGATFMTVSVVAGVDARKPTLTPVTFVIAGNRIATVRYADFVAFRQFLARSVKPDAGCSEAAGIFLSFNEAIIDRIADVIERSGAHIDRFNRNVFKQARKSRKRRSLERMIGQLGFQGDIVSKARESLTTMERMLQFAAAARPLAGDRKAQDSRIKLMSRDVRSLADQLTFLSNKITFLLDATLGLISIDQNEVIRLLTVASVVFFPPTIIGTIYGMNFDFMPELHWSFGYPLAVIAMILSALLPILYFRRRGWF